MKIKGRVVARVFDPMQKKRRPLRLVSRGIEWRLRRIDENGQPIRDGKKVGHGDFILAPVEVVDNKRIFKVDDYPDYPNEKVVI